MNKRRILDNTFLLRAGAAVIFLSHSLHGIFTNNDVNDFGNLFLNKIGFAPLGVLLAWLVVVGQLISSVLLLANRFVTISCIVNIVILVTGIITVHYREGWFVVGAGRNGMEFSFVLLVVLFAILLLDQRRANK